MKQENSLEDQKRQWERTITISRWSERMVWLFPIVGGTFTTAQWAWAIDWSGGIYDWAITVLGLGMLWFGFSMGWLIALVVSYGIAYGLLSGAWRIWKSEASETTPWQKREDMCLIGAAVFWFLFLLVSILNKYVVAVFIGGFELLTG